MIRLRTFAAFLALAPFAPGAAAAPEIEKAELIKAAMIEKIARFIDWPGPAPARFGLCIGGDHPQLGAVKAYYESFAIGDRPVEIQVLKRSDGMAGCRALFLAPREMADIGRLKAIAEKGHVLLVAEGADAARNGAHVAFYSDMNKLRLEVNRRGLEASGLKASFRLLEMAKVVE